MAYIKAYDVTIVTAFRATVAKFPNRVMYVNASIGTEWTYSKVMGVKLPLIYHFSLHLRDSGGGCCWSKESIRGQGGMVFLFNSIRLQRIIGGFRDTGCLLCKPPFGQDSQSAGTPDQTKQTNKHLYIFYFGISFPTI